MASGAVPKFPAKQQKWKAVQLSTNQPQIKMCLFHGSRNGCSDESCTDLHICKFYLEKGLCKFGSKCKFGHSLETQHNKRCLLTNHITNANIDVVKSLINRSPAHSKFPWICKFYNTAAPGCKHGIDGMHCTAMHICIHYVKGECVMGKRCKREHNIYAPQPRALLMRNGIDVSRSRDLVLAELRKSLPDTSRAADKQPELIRGCSVADLWSILPTQQSVQPGSRPELARGFSMANLSSVSPEWQPDTRPVFVSSDSSEICFFYLRNQQCLYKNKCHNFHCNQPFQWQHYKERVGQWLNFSDKFSEEIETSYTDPNKEMFHSTPEQLLSTQPSFVINFDEMTVKWQGSDNSEQVRRLSTKSWVMAPPNHQQLSTRWQWYWKDEHGDWVEYGQGGHETDINSKTLEKEYLDDPDGKFKFSTEHFQYTIDFSTMFQKNDYFGTERKISRRPVFSCMSLAEESSVSTLANVEMPEYWDKHFSPDDPYFKIVKLQKTGKTRQEYQKVKDRFEETMSPDSWQILSIGRIQNVELWQGYLWHQNWLKQKTEKSGVCHEMLLFHGTRKEYVEPICHQGFDWRLSGTSVGTVYGKGSYFAKDASYSCNYADNELFLVRVMIGDYTRGNQTYVVPPYKPGSKKQRYHCCVDDTENPSIFVIFERQQSYPEYLIKYRQCKSEKSY